MWVLTQTNLQSFIQTIGGSRARQLNSLALWSWPTPVNIVSDTYTSMVRSLRKSLCSGFSTSTTPQGYRRPRIFFPFTSISWLEPITAKGMLAWNKHMKQWDFGGGGMEKRMENMFAMCFCILCISHFQDPGLLFELLILVGVGIRQLVDSDPVLCNLIQDLMMESTKTGWNDGGDDLTVTSCGTFYWT